MATLLKIGADVTGAEKVNRLAKDLREAADATDALAKSSQKGNTEFKTMSSVMAGLARESEKLTSSISQSKNVLAGFKTSLDGIWSSGKLNSGLKEFESSIKEVGRNLSYSRQQLSDFITTSGRYSIIATANSQATYATSVALRAEEAARDGLLKTEAAYVDAKARELLLTDRAAISLAAETVAVNAQIAAYQKLNVSGKMGNYEKGFDYVNALKAENASIAAQEKGLATLSQQFATLKAVRSTLKQGDYAAQIAAENASIAAQERGLATLSQQFTALKAVRSTLKQGDYAAQIAAENASIAAQERGLATLSQQFSALKAVRSTLKQGDYAAQIAAENASIAAQEEGLATLSQQFSALKAVRSTLKQGDYAAQIAAENASIAAQERGLKELENQFKRVAVARAALKQGSYAVSDYAQSGRDKLAAGSMAGGYDYAEQIKRESSAFDEVSGKMKTQQGVLNSLGDAWDNAGKKSSIFHNLMRGASGAMGGLWLTYGQMIPMIAGFATAAATIKTVQLGAEFDDIARKISFLETSAGGAAITTEQLKKQLLAIGKAPQSLTEQAEGLLEFSRAGVSAAEALKPIQQEGGKTTSKLEQLSAMAYYSGTKLQDITAQVQKFASAYNTDVITTANVVSKIADISQASIPTMMRAFENATSQNVLFGSSIEEVAAVLGVMHDKGIDAAKAGAALTTAMTKLVNPTDKVNEQFHQLGFSAIDATTGKTKDLVTMFGDLQKAADKLPASMRAAFLEDSGGLRGLKAIAPGIASSQQALTDFNKTIGDYVNKVREAGGEGGKQFTYLQHVMESLGESGKYNLDLLVASVKDLFVTSYDNASSVRMMEELRAVVTAQDTKDSLSFIVEKILWLTTAAAKTITFTIKILDSTDADTNRKLALIGGLVGARFGGVKGAALGSTVATIGGGALLDALGINNKSLGELDTAKTKVKELQEALTYQQTAAQAASNPITKTYHDYKVDDVTKRLQAEREIVAELEKNALAQNSITQATGKSTGAVGKLTEAQIAAGDEALKSLDYYTKQSSLVGKSEVEKVQARISETIADQKKKLDAAGMSAEEYNKVLSESEEVIRKSFGPELEAAKKKDIALTSDQILANRAASAGRRAEAEANKEANEAMKRLLATYDVYLEKVKDISTAAAEKVRNDKELLRDVDSFIKTNQTVGMSKSDAETYKRNEELTKSTEVLERYKIAVAEAQAELGLLGDVYGQTVSKLAEFQQQVAANPLEYTQDQVEQKTKGLVNEQQKLVKEYDNVKQGQDDLIAKSEKLIEVTGRLYAVVKDVSPWAAMKKGLDSVTYTSEDMFKDVQSATEHAFSGMTDALTEFVTTGKLSFSDLANSIISDLAKIAVQQSIVGPLASGLSSLFSSSSAGSTTSSAFSIASIFGSAKGNAFSSISGLSNGVYDKPTYFNYGSHLKAFANGGVLGEKYQPEAVVPLKRTSSGNLGIEAEGLGGSNVIINISTPANTAVTQKERNENGSNIIDIMVEQVENKVWGNVAKGNGLGAQTLQSVYGLNRATGAY